MALAYVRRRLPKKQLAPAQYVANQAVLQALADEGWREVTALSEDARRKHVHWVHVKTDNPMSLSSTNRNVLAQWPSNLEPDQQLTSALTS